MWNFGLISLVISYLLYEVLTVIIVHIIIVTCTGYTNGWMQLIFNARTDVANNELYLLNK